MIRVAINGFGRIGRNVFRAGIDEKNIEFVALNDLMDPNTLGHLLKYDSIHGRFSGNVKEKNGNLEINGKILEVYDKRDPAELPWDELDIDIVVESTGFFTHRAGAKKHLDAGADKVVISAPAVDPDITIVMGVNHKDYKSNYSIISNASCTTNCLAPVAKVLDQKFGINQGFLSTCHSYTSSQRILDLPHRDLRRSRAAALSIIPTTTGAAKAIGIVLPNLNGKLDGMSLRVPTPNGSINDLVAELREDTTKRDINNAFRSAAENELNGIMEYTEEPIVSRDIIDNPHSSIVDGLSTNVLGDKGNFVKVLSWYDNEWGFSSRIIDLIKYVS
jgi:glyceraldehyde 3-phosphate dehydrogenase|tara:strand:+ start:15947 stop:16942 length:996 start_codon:yes stop_codon:yes gene_type:complete